MAKPIAPDVVRACVVSGGITTPYRIAGRGRPVVVLSFDSACGDAALRDAAADHRVIVPDFIAGSAAVEAARQSPRAWLVAFLEALALGEVRMLVDASLAADARHIARLYPELVATVEVLAQRAVQRLSHVAGGPNVDEHRPGMPSLDVDSACTASDSRT